MPVGVAVTVVEEEVLDEAAFAVGVEEEELLEGILCAPIWFSCAFVNSKVPVGILIAPV